MLINALCPGASMKFCMHLTLICFSMQCIANSVKCDENMHQSRKFTLECRGYSPLNELPLEDVSYIFNGKELGKGLLGVFRFVALIDSSLDNSDILIIKCTGKSEDNSRPLRAQTPLEYYKEIYVLYLRIVKEKKIQVSVDPAKIYE
jgi:hypothetical protein